MSTHLICLWAGGYCVSNSGSAIIDGSAYIGSYKVMTPDQQPIQTDLSTPENSKLPGRIRHLFWSKHKRILLLLLLLVVLVGGFFGYHYATKSTHKTISENAMVAKVDIELAESKPNAAINSIRQSGIPTNNVTTILLINAYSDKKQYSKALALYKQYISRFGASLGILGGAGDMAVKSGDISQAISYYQQVITDYKKSNNPLAGAYVTYYQNMISRLQGSK